MLSFGISKSGEQKDRLLRYVKYAVKSEWPLQVIVSTYNSSFQLIKLYVSIFCNRLPTYKVTALDQHHVAGQVVRSAT